jgi:NhaP-type Na+/H+ or K+/H+ antiporter
MICRTFCSSSLRQDNPRSSLSDDGYPPNYYLKENTMSLGTILLIILIFMLIGAIPSWPHSRNWGYGPSGGLGLVVVVLIILLVLGRI